MDIVKKNFVSILCGVVAVICLILVFYPFGGMYKALVAQVEASKQVGDQITNIRHTARNWPTLDSNDANHVALTHFPTPATLDLGSKMTQSWTQEATDFLNHAASFQIGRLVQLVPGSLPGVPGQLSTAYHFGDAYRDIFNIHYNADGSAAPSLGVLKGEMPPSDADVTAQTAAKVLQIQNTLPSKVGDRVINQDQVDAAIAQAKIDTGDAMRQRVALNSAIYLDPIQSFQPEARVAVNTGNAPSVNDIFIAQVGLWVQQEICRAIAETNQASQRGVLDAPIKRLLSIRVTLPFVALPPPPGQAPGDPVVAPGAQVLPAARVATDFVKNPLGQTSNDFYDVIPFTLLIICDADTVPNTLTSLTRNRYMMIRSMDVLSVDSAVAYAQGFIFGNKPVVQLNLRCQYLMLRKFLGPQMPQDIIRGLTAPVIAQ